jgi:hypothetical protein
LVELFTSEGCSSCPPADKLLERLDKMQPFPGVQLIVMSEHVDYWNHDGWVDPYSSSEFTVRQQEYDQKLKAAEPFTPQMIVDGMRQCLGNDPVEVKATILDAARNPKMAVRIVAGNRPQSVSVEIDGTPPPQPADVYVAFAQDPAESKVARGENRGLTLHHVAVVRKLRRLGKLGKNPDFRSELPVSGFGGARLIAFVQEKSTGRVLGAGMYRIPDAPSSK